MGLFSGKCNSLARLEGKTVIITGANTGIGKVTALDLFKRGANVIIACRNVDKAKAALQDIHRVCKDAPMLGTIEILELNLASFKSVRNCASRLLQRPKIDILINNAGVMCCPYTKTEDGYEMHFQTNYLGHFLLTLLLMPKIIEAESARIINVSSLVHTAGCLDFEDLNYEKKPYKALKAYQQSKLCNILFSKELARRLQRANVVGITTYSLHPGVITTELGRHLDTTYFRGLRWIWRFFMVYFLKTPEQGAQTTIYCAVDEKAGQETGLYYSDCKVKEPAKQANNVEDAKRLWDTQNTVYEIVYDMSTRQGTLEDRLTTIEDKIATLQEQLDLLPELIMSRFQAHAEKVDQRKIFFTSGVCGRTSTSEERASWMSMAQSCFTAGWGGQKCGTGSSSYGNLVW